MASSTCNIRKDLEVTFSMGPMHHMHAPFCIVYNTLHRCLIAVGSATPAKRPCVDHETTPMVCYCITSLTQRTFRTACSRLAQTAKLQTQVLWYVPPCFPARIHFLSLPWFHAPRLER